MIFKVFQASAETSQDCCLHCSRFDAVHIDLAAVFVESTGKTFIASLFQSVFLPETAGRHGHGVGLSTGAGQTSSIFLLRNALKMASSLQNQSVLPINVAVLF